MAWSMVNYTVVEENDRKHLEPEMVKFLVHFDLTGWKRVVDPEPWPFREHFRLLNDDIHTDKHLCLLYLHLDERSKPPGILRRVHEVTGESSQCCKSKNKQGVGQTHFFSYYTTPIAQSLVLSCLTWRYLSHNVKTPLIRIFSLFGFHFIQNSLCRLARIFLRHLLLPQLACSL